MPRTSIPRPSPAMGVALTALVFAMSGSALAAKSLITGKDVKNGSLTGADVRNGSLTGADVRNGSLTNADVKLRTLTGSRIRPASIPLNRLQKQPAGTPGPAGPAGPQGDPGPAGAPGRDGSTQTTVYRLSPAYELDGLPHSGTTPVNPYPVTGTSPRDVTGGVACPDGTYPVGGGVQTTDSREGANVVNSLFPVVNPDGTRPSGYVAAVDNLTIEDSGFRVYVICQATQFDGPDDSPVAPLNQQYTRYLKEAVR